MEYLREFNCPVCNSEWYRYYVVEEEDDRKIEVWFCPNCRRQHKLWLRYSDVADDYLVYDYMDMGE